MLEERVRGSNEVTHFERRIQMKRLFAIALICLFGLAVGCGGAATPEATEPEGDSPDVAAAEDDMAGEEGLGDEIDAPAEDVAEEPME